MRIAVFGAGGRAGRRVTAEAVRRGHEVVAVVRDVVAHGGLASDVAALNATDVAARSGAVSVHRGDVTDAASVRRLADGCDAVVSAVTPASGPEALARMRLDERYFVKAADALLAARAPRLAVVGLFATLHDASGGLVMDDPSAFPPQLRAFAQAHLAGLERLREETDQQWLVLTPTARLEPDGVRTGRYRLGGEQVPHDETDGLSYADLAVAILDEIERPTRYGRVVVYR
ncbi:NAD(P)H-binding protein [Dactylosporangium sp. AC04546]|uniref:NAD(P)-dependent oxidoreductase n=1 Tax=Dactylosporangium sp. AC04546 TaxID=2862460 RepID=UPI001EDD0B38|nr:NAD(P)H-binding protein [Dactylosporangium sp. AC04546]WVK87959.1 NAD(P)H-binding protein [Dactylosporangium sp. AC04546]